MTDSSQTDSSLVLEETKEQKQEKKEAIAEQASALLGKPEDIPPFDPTVRTVLNKSYAERLEKEKILEAALFMSPKPVTLEELNEIAAVGSRIDTRAMMAELINYFNSKKSSIEIVELPVGYQMRVKAEYEDAVKKYASEGMFNKGVMKTLAMIAYKQPIAQSEVVKYRNNKAYDHLKALFDAGLIKKEPKGRTYVLTTTTKFIEYFGKDMRKKK